MKTKIFRANCTRVCVLFAALLGSASLTFGADALPPSSPTQSNASTPNSLPRDRNDMVTSNDTKTNAVGTQPKTRAVELSRSDRRFVEKAAQGGQMEVKLGRLAQDHAADPQVKAFGERLISDHGKANQELNALADRKGVNLAQEDEEGHIFNKLSSQNGTEFDKSFVDHMVDDHREDIEMFEKAAKKSDDPDIAAYAAEQLPVLRAHLAQAESLKSGLGK
jgi:putative membrane protein